MAYLESHWASLQEGTIEVGTLNYISEKKKAFAEILTTNKATETTLCLVFNTIEVRLKEVQRFEKQAEQLTHLVSMCQNLGKYCLKINCFSPN